MVICKNLVCNNWKCQSVQAKGKRFFRVGNAFVKYHLAESATRGVRCKKPKACNFIKKETLAQVFSCEFSKNTFFYRTPLVVASAKSSKRNCFCERVHTNDINDNVITNIKRQNFTSERNISLLEVFIKLQ